MQHHHTTYPKQPPHHRQHHCLGLGLFALLACLLYGCAASTSRLSTPPHDQPISEALTDRNQGYALLYQLVEKNQKVGQILAIKSVTPLTAKLIHQIAQFCRETYQQLNGYRQQDPALTFTANGLPFLEAQTRQALEAAITKSLLFSSGDLFEKRLLTIQAQSMSYLAHLTLTVSQHEANTDRRQFLEQTSEQASQLHDQIIERLAIAPSSQDSVRH